jgi:hypothetical protein
VALSTMPALPTRLMGTITAATSSFRNSKLVAKPGAATLFLTYSTPTGHKT